MMHTAVKWLLGAGAAAALVGVAVAHANTNSEDMPEALRVRVARALQSADPAQMHELATELRHQGFGDQAKTLDQAAAEIERAITKTPGAKLQPKSPRALPGAPAAAGGLAGKVALAFTGEKAYGEGEQKKSLLKTYQTQEKERGFYVGNIDGLYGPKSALALAQDQGIVPPPPLYWPKKDPAAAKTAYRNKLLAIAERDVQRREEWQQAAQV